MLHSGLHHCHQYQCLSRLNSPCKKQKQLMTAVIFHVSSQATGDQNFCTIFHFCRNFWFLYRRILMSGFYAALQALWSSRRFPPPPSTRPHSRSPTSGWSTVQSMLSRCMLPRCDILTCMHCCQPFQYFLILLVMNNAREDVHRT